MASSSSAVLELSDHQRNDTRVEIIEPTRDAGAAERNDIATLSGNILWSRSILRRLGENSSASNSIVFTSVSLKRKLFYVGQGKTLGELSEVERLGEVSASDASDHESLLSGEQRGHGAAGRSSRGGRSYLQLRDNGGSPETPRTRRGWAQSSRLAGLDRFLTVKHAAFLSIIINLLLFALKLASAIISNSLSVLSCLVDSALDLFVCLVLFISHRLLRPKNADPSDASPAHIEPVAVIVCVCVVTATSFQLIAQSFMSFLQGDAKPRVSSIPGAFLSLAVVLKCILYVLCRRVDNPSVQALAEDHRNDILSNAVALMFGFMGTYVQGWLDPVGALLIVVVIIVNWTQAGKEQVGIILWYNTISPTTVFSPRYSLSKR